MNGEKKTGVTVIEMDEGMDTGDIILQEAITVGEDETTGASMTDCPFLEQPDCQSSRAY